MGADMTGTADEFATKVPEVTLVFWIIKKSFLV